MLLGTCPQTGPDRRLVAAPGQSQNWHPQVNIPGQPTLRRSKGVNEGDHMFPLSPVAKRYGTSSYSHLSLHICEPCASYLHMGRAGLDAMRVRTGGAGDCKCDALSPLRVPSIIPVRRLRLSLLRGCLLLLKPTAFDALKLPCENLLHALEGPWILST